MLEEKERMSGCLVRPMEKASIIFGLYNSPDKQNTNNKKRGHGVTEERALKDKTKLFYAHRVAQMYTCTSIKM